MDIYIKMQLIIDQEERNWQRMYRMRDEDMTDVQFEKWLKTLEKIEKNINDAYTVCFDLTRRNPGQLILWEKELDRIKKKND